VKIAMNAVVRLKIFPLIAVLLIAGGDLPAQSAAGKSDKKGIT